MQEHLAKAQDNEDCHACLSKTFPNKFYDWRTTILFYAALHYLKALAAQRGVAIGDSHNEIREKISPKSIDRVTEISPELWSKYTRMASHAHNARYVGIRNRGLHDRLLKENYEDCKKCFTAFKLHIKRGEGLIIPE